MAKPVALITGGSMGLGKAVAEHFCNAGYEVVTCARHGGTFELDVSSPNSVWRMLRDIENNYGRLDVLVCNAAVYGPVSGIDEGDWLEWRQAFEINVMGVMLPCRYAIPIMKRQKYGKIVTLSGGGERPKLGCSAYNASKAAVQRFTECLSVDLEGTGIDVNCVAPGVLDTRMRLSSSKPENPEWAMQNAVDCIAWLASDTSDGISGRLFSAVWDDLDNLPKPLGKDDYRMRRVVPV